MVDWNVFIPRRQDIEKLREIAAGQLFIHSGRSPIWTAISVPDARGRWITLTWDYFDVQFKFEVYGLSIESPGAGTSADLIPMGIVPEFASVHFLLKTSWLRPALPGEVPEAYEQVIEESGTITMVPASATAIATTLHGVALLGADNDPLIVIALDEAVNYSLGAIVHREAMVAVTETCDSLTLDEVIRWTPTQIL